jgi:hypothetical protein
MLRTRYGLSGMEQKLPTLEWIGKDKVINHYQDVTLGL